MKIQNKPTILFTNRHQDLQTEIANSPLKNHIQVTMQQIHGNNVEIINNEIIEQFSNKTIYQSTNIPISNTDAIITDQPNLALIVRTADCLPILIHHPAGIIAAIHAGRKGTEKKILIKTLEKIEELAKAKTSQQRTNSKRLITIWFGPRICHKCYQIDRETDLHYDLIKENINQLNQQLSTNNYQLSIKDMCTSCQNQDYFSYRKEGKGVGMNYGVIGLQKPPA